MVFACLVDRKGAADPQAVEKLAGWVDARNRAKRRGTSGDADSHICE